MMISAAMRLPLEIMYLRSGLSDAIGNVEYTKYRSLFVLEKQPILDKIYVL